MEKTETSKQLGLMSIVASIVGLVVLSGVVYVVMQNTPQPAPLAAESATAEVEMNTEDLEVSADENRPSYTTRKRVEVLKSNEQADPSANQYESAESAADEALDPADEEHGSSTVESGSNPLYEQKASEGESAMYEEY